jgi:hypothetical protein
MPISRSLRAATTLSAAAASLAGQARDAVASMAPAA